MLTALLMLSPFAAGAAAFAVFAAAVGGDPLFWMRPRVWLIDHQGDVYRGRLRTDRNGVNWSAVYPFTGIGHAVLFENGEARGSSSYIMSWSFTKPPSLRPCPIEARNAKWARR